MTVAVESMAPGRPFATPSLAWLALGGITLAALMDAVNGTVLSISGAQIMGGVRATPDEIAWVNMAYVIAKLTGFPLAAWTVVRFGARQPLLWSVCLLIGASAAAGLTTNLGPLVVWRAAQGALGAVLLVSGQAALFVMFPRERQGLVQATFALSIVMGPTTVAPALQGWITDELSWSWIFILNLPVGALGLLAIVGGMDAVPDERRPSRSDAVGLTLLAVAMGWLVFVLQEGSRYDWFEEAEIVHLSTVGTAALLLFVAWEVRAQGRGALIDVAVFRDENFAFGFLVSFIAGFALFGKRLRDPGLRAPGPSAHADPCGPAAP